MANYSFGIVPIPKVEDRHTFTEDNFTQLKPDTKILEGVAKLRFVRCTLINCVLPEDAVIDSCCGPAQVEFCSHLHAKWIDKGLAECAEQCAHMKSADQVVIDGVVVTTVYNYEDTWRAK